MIIIIGLRAERAQRSKSRTAKRPICSFHGSDVTDEVIKHHLIQAGTLTDLVGNQLVLIAGKGKAPPVTNAREL